MRLHNKLEISEISRRTSLSRNTIKKWLREPDSDKVKYQRGNVDIIITPYAAWLDTALKADSQRPKRDRRTARRLYEELIPQGFTGHYCRVTEYVKQGASTAVRAQAKPHLSHSSLTLVKPINSIGRKSHS
jgi:hypothetical protein